MFFSIKYRYSDILLKKHKLHLSRLFCCNHTCYCVNTISVTPASRYIPSASRYHPRYQRRSSMYIRGLMPRNFTEIAEAILIGFLTICQSTYWRVSSLQRVNPEQVLTLELWGLYDRDNLGPWVLGIWGEGLFIFRELRSNDNHFQEFGEQVHSFGDLGSPANK